MDCEHCDCPDKKEFDVTVTTSSSEILSNKMKSDAEVADDLGITPSEYRDLVTNALFEEKPKPNGGIIMKNKIIRLLIAMGIIGVFLLIAIGLNTLVVILSDKIGFNLEYILIPILTVWLIWLVYEIVNRNENNKMEE